MIEALDLCHPIDDGGCVEGKLTVWKLNDPGGSHTGLYAVGRTRESAIVTRSWDWNSIQAVINADQEQELQWREHNSRSMK